MLSTSTRLCIYLNALTILGIISSLKPVSTSRNLSIATLSKASSGHSLNQSKVQQLTKDGNILNRLMNELPKGDMAKTTWICFNTLARYTFITLDSIKLPYLFMTSALTALMISSLSTCWA